MRENSTWTALRNPVFRNMWLVSLISGTCVAAQDTAATWTVNRLSTSPLFLSLLATVASLPFFFFTLPAGALADMVDRKRMMFIMTVWLAIHRLKRAKPVTKLPLESFLESFVSAIRYVRYAPGIQVVLARNLLFAFFISIIPALIPVVGLKELHLDPSSLGLVFTCMGIGSVLGAVLVLPWARASFRSNTVTLLANILVAVVFFMMATIREPISFMVTAALAGTAWTLAASELWVAGQRAMPSWARGRMNATIIMTAQGAVALGGIVWGSSVSMWGVKWTLLVACILQLGTLLLQLWLSIDFTNKLDFEPAPAAGPSHQFMHTPAPA